MSTVSEQKFFPTNYGHFASERAYVITNPDAPRPWTNVICNGRYGLVVSHRGGGFSWFDDAQHNVLTRWEMDLIRDCYGKFLYLADRESGEIWSVAPAPCNTKHDSYRCTHELGATTFETTAHGIESKWTLSVAASDGVELWHVELKNTSAKPRKLRMSSYFEWTCGAAPDVKREFHKLFFTTAHDAKRRAIIATKNMWDIPGLSEKDHWNVAWPHAAAHAVFGPAFERDIAIADKATFLGRYTSTATPRTMQKDCVPGSDTKSGGFGRFGDACAALGGDFTLAAGASISFHYVIAIAKDETSVKALIDQYRDADAPAKTLAGARKLWSDTLASTRVESSSPDIDLLANAWLPYQAISARSWGRTGYYQQSGAFGYRDQLQDSQVWLPLEPARCKAQILLHATRMFEDGSVNHWWHALANFGNHTECSDDYLWLAFVTASYIRETGDFAILNENAPFQKSKLVTSLKDHCERAIERSFKRMSPRGLPLIGSCDWNDGLSALGLEGKGESVWLAMFLCSILSEWTMVYSSLRDAAGASRCQARREALMNAINTHAWDAEGKSGDAAAKGHFRCATKDNGEWIGASSSPEGKIHLNPQTWSVLAQTSSHDRIAAAWQSAKQKLLTPYGPLLLAPAYSIPDPDIGYITRYSPGSRENGGVYMHAATWALAAACAMRDQGAVEQIWTSIAPPIRGNDADAYAAEPYVLPGNVDGPLGEKPGTAGWTWYTGSAAWLRRVVHEWVLGVRPVWGTDSKPALLIDPVPFSGLGKVRFARKWRSWTLNVRFDAQQWKPNARPTVTLNGVPVPDAILTEQLANTHISDGGVGEVAVEWK